MMSERARRLLLATALTVCAATPVVAAIFNVNSDASLRNAINSAQNGDTIQFTDHITLNANSDLNAIQRNITIDGGNFDLQANGNRGFLIYSGSVAIQNIVVRGAVAQGGTGGGGSGAGGGGGAGLGGGLFVNAGATVTASGFYAIQNQAVGGQGGSIQTPVGFGGWGGGGGMGGRGGDGAQTGAGGGGGVGQSAGGGSNGNDGSGGTVSGAGSGGIGGPAIPIVGGGTNDGGGSGGGGGGGTSFPINVVVAGGGGVSGGNGSFVNSDGRGGAGGFGGGGGGGGFAINNNIGIGTTAGGGNGGFGGGGGAGDKFGGAGGFGGGGGGGSGMFINNPGGGGGAGGTGGFGGGNGAGTNVLPPSVTGLFSPGGGGAGLGGGIFVREGGTLILGSGFVNSNSVAGGAVGTSLYGGAQAGSAYGEGLFLQGNGTLTLAPPASSSLSILDDIADQTGSGGTGGNAGSWGIVVMGAGQAYFSGDNTYSGGTSIEPGARLRINRNSALGSGAVTIKDQATLVAETNANTIANPIGLAGTATVGVFTATTISGPITGGGSLVVSATANGSYGILRLSNGGNAYSGSTTITAGTLALSGAGSIASSSGLFLASGATFDISGATNGASITTLANAPGSSGADEIIALGSKTLTITNATAFSTVYGGVIQDGGVAGGTGGSLVVAGGAQILTGINTYTGSTTIRSGATLALFGGSLGAGDYAGAIRNDGSLFIVPAQRLSGVISGSGALLAGTSLTLAGNNTYTGRTDIDAGATLNIVDSGVLGSGNYTGPIVSAGTLRYASSAAQILSGSIGDDPFVSGSPARIVLDGPGDLTLSRANNTFSGGVTVNEATLRDGANRSFGSGPIVVNGNGALVNRFTQSISSLDVKGSAVVASGPFSIASLTVNGAVTGTGSLQVGDNGLFGSSLRIGATTNSIGTLAVGFAGSVIFTGGAGSKLVVGSDYVGNWGSGNSFNPTAGVTGGTIEAAGTGTLQTITGAQVNNGGSATPTLLFGNVHVGTTASFAVKNTGTNTPMLRGAVQTTGLSGGAVTGLTDGDFGPIASGSSTAAYTLTAATAGPLSGQSVRVVSNFANVPTQTIAVAGNVYAYAAPSLSSTSVTLNNFHVGQNPGPGSFPIQNTATGPNGYVETLAVTPTASGSGFFASPTSFKVGAGGTGFVNVFLNGGVAGLNTGTVALGLASDGADIGNGLGTTPLPGQTVAVSAKGYALAAATPSTSSVTMSAFHVGSTSSGNFQVQNTGVGPSGYVEALYVSTVAGMNHGQLSSTPYLAPVGQGGSDTVYLSLTGGAAGPNSGIVILSLASDGNAIGNGLGLTSLAGQSVTVTATGYNYAAPQYQKAGGDGTLMGSGTAYTLDFGTVTAGTTVSGSLNLLNALVGGATSIYTDLLSGSFSVGFGSFDLAGFTGFSGVAGGSTLAPLTVGFDTGKEGFFQQVITLNASSDNTAGLGSTALGPITLTIAGNVVAVPEPSTWALIAAGIIGFVARRGHRRDA